MKLTSLSLTQSTHSWLSTYSWRYWDFLYLILLVDIQFPNMDGLKNIILLQFHSGSQPPPPPTHLVFVAADRKRCIFYFPIPSNHPQQTAMQSTQDTARGKPVLPFFRHCRFAIQDKRIFGNPPLWKPLSTTMSDQPWDCGLSANQCTWRTTSSGNCFLPLQFANTNPRFTISSALPHTKFVQNGNGALTD